MEEKQQNLIEEVESVNDLKQKKQRTIKLVALTIFTLLIIAFFVFVLQFRIRYVSMTVEGWSMLPNFNETTESDAVRGDEVYVNTYAEIKAGDVVVIQSVALKESIIKRCIATGGQTVNICGRNKIGQKSVKISNYQTISINVYEEYYVEVDGKELDESYIIDTSDKKTMQKEFESFCIWKYKNGYASNMESEIKLTQNQIFALGDNRKASTDSSSVGPFNSSEIVGRVDFIIKYKTNYIQECLQKLSFIFIIK